MNAELIELSDPLHTFRGVWVLLTLGLLVVLCAFLAFGGRGAPPTPGPATEPDSDRLDRSFRWILLAALFQMVFVVALVWMLIFGHLGWVGLIAMSFFAAPSAVAYLHARRRGRLFSASGS